MRTNPLNGGGGVGGKELTQTFFVQSMTAGMTKQQMKLTHGMTMLVLEVYITGGTQ